MWVVVGDCGPLGVYEKEKDAQVSADRWGALGVETTQFEMAVTKGT